MSAQELPPKVNELTYNDAIKLIDQRVPSVGLDSPSYEENRRLRDVAYRAIRLLDNLGFTVEVRHG